LLIPYGNEFNGHFNPFAFIQYKKFGWEEQVESNENRTQPDTPWMRKYAPGTNPKSEINHPSNNS